MLSLSHLLQEFDNFAELDIKDIYFHNETDELLEGNSKKKNPVHCQLVNHEAK